MLKQKNTDNNLFTVGFYNLENLFDFEDDSKTLDDDFTEYADRKWNKERFRKKIKKLSKVISRIGVKEISHPPILLGVAEVENSYVLEKLTTAKHLKPFNYGFVHFDSPDERGIDTALLYRKEEVSIIKKQTHTLYITSETGERDYTRDILHVTCSYKNEILHILVNHWPSRRAGVQETVYKRVIAAQKNREICDSIIAKNPDSKIIIMGDFNDDPKSESLQKLAGNEFYNPMELLHTKYEGSLNYKGNWNLFDQILISNSFFQVLNNPIRFKEAIIFNRKIVQEYTGKYKGNPFRTYIGKKYIGGYSDHFPVFALFSIKLGATKKIIT